MHRASIAVFLVLVATSAQALAGPAVDRDELRKELAAQRDLNLKRFHAYRKAGVYPHNSYEQGFINVWRDDDQHLCAVANLVAKQGNDELVDSVASEENFVRIADVSSGPLLDWVLTSGFTQEEIAMIQYPTFAQDDPVGYARMMREQRRKERAREREDARLAAGYRETEHTLKQSRVHDAGLDIAVARLAARPDLVEKLHAVASK
jgi:hypothetical protein